jgi:hypothetical protein
VVMGTFSLDDWVVELNVIHEARLSRKGAARPRKIWRLPHDLFRAGPETFELEAHTRPEDGSMAEITLTNRGRLLGIAVVREKKDGTASGLGGGRP